MIGTITIRYRQWTVRSFLWQLRGIDCCLLMHLRYHDNHGASMNVTMTITEHLCTLPWQLRSINVTMTITEHLCMLPSQPRMIIWLPKRPGTQTMKAWHWLHRSNANIATFPWQLLHKHITMTLVAIATDNRKKHYAVTRTGIRWWNRGWRHHPVYVIPPTKSVYQLYIRSAGVTCTIRHLL